MMRLVLMVPSQIAVARLSTLAWVGVWGWEAFLSSIQMRGNSNSSPLIKCLGYTRLHANCTSSLSYFCFILSSEACFMSQFGNKLTQSTLRVAVSHRCCSSGREERLIASFLLTLLFKITVFFLLNITQPSFLSL